VDGVFVVGAGATQKRVWCAGVVLGKRPAKSGDDYQVFWLGHPPSFRAVGGKVKNPTWESVHSLRSHVDGSVNGTEDAWLNIEDIRKEYDPATRSELVGEQPQPQPLDPATRSELVGEQPQPQVLEQQQQSNDVTGSSRSRPKRDSSAREKYGDTAADDVSGHSKSKRKQGSSPQKKDSKKTSQPAPATQTPSVRAPAQFALHIKTFEVCDSVSYAISCLESFDRGDVEHPSVFGQLEERILALARSLAAMYHNPNYMDGFRPQYNPGGANFFLELFFLFNL
jgi:hypothetical protein